MTRTPRERSWPLVLRRVLWRGRSRVVLAPVTLRATEDQVREARHRARRALAPYRMFDPDCAEELVSEVATNSVTHSRSKTFTLAITRTRAGQLRLSVTDDGNGDRTPHMRAGNHEDGRGMRLVDVWAESWGVIHAKGQVTVWMMLGDRSRTAAREEAASALFAPEAEALLALLSDPEQLLALGADE